VALLLVLLLGISWKGIASATDTPISPSLRLPSGDGQTDLTRAFQEALDSTAAAGGGIVSVPAGKYLIKGHLTIPENVTLEGIWRAPVNGRPFDSGSVLLATEGQGNADGTPFISMSTNSTLSGLTIFYPEQIIANPPHAYPWTIQSVDGADNCAIRNVTIVNPYQAVDFGTHVTGRHFIDGLYAYPLFKGLYINQCYDVGRIQNIHFWPFWDVNPNSPLWAFTKEKGTAFIIGRTDGEMAVNLFSIFYRTGMHFIAGPTIGPGGEIRNQPGSGIYTNCYMDVSPCAIKVDAVAPDAGVSFVNGMFMSGVEVAPMNRGQVKFTACAFYGMKDIVSHAKIEGRGAVFFESCHFGAWDGHGDGAACIDANGARLLVNGCEFNGIRRGQYAVSLGPRTRSAVISSNLMPCGVNIRNRAPKNAGIEIGLNAAEPDPGYLRKWTVIGPFPNPAIPAYSPGQPSRAGFDTDYLASIGGEANAAITPATTVTYWDAQGQAQTVKGRTLEANAQGTVDFKETFPEGKQVAYAFGLVHSKRMQKGHFEMGANDCPKVWVNGKLAFSYWSNEGDQSTPGAYAFDADLRKGLNPILVKVEDAGGRRWEFMLAAYGEDGESLLK